MQYFIRTVLYKELAHSLFDVYFILTLNLHQIFMWTWQWLSSNIRISLQLSLRLRMHRMTYYNSMIWYQCIWPSLRWTRLISLKSRSVSVISVLNVENLTIQCWNVFRVLIYLHQSLKTSQTLISKEVWSQVSTLAFFCLLLVACCLLLVACYLHFSVTLTVTSSMIPS